MDTEGLDREWSAWLEERKRTTSPPPDPAFTRRVMEAVRAEARKAAGNAAAGATAQAPGQAPAQTRPEWRPWSRPARGRSGWPEWIRALLSPGPALALATLALAAGLAIRFYPAGPGADADGTRIKGQGFHVGYLLKRGASISPARSGEGYGPGDRLQAVYSADRAGYIEFFSLDASGRIECLSCSGADSVSPAGQDKTFPFALELDADPADEALVGFWTPAPADPKALEAWLREAWGRSGGDFPGLEKALPKGVPSGTRVSFFLMRKKAGI